LSSGAKITWQSVLGKGYSGVSIRGNRLYTMGNDGSNDTVWCLNADSGAVIWKYSYACGNNEYPGPRSTPTLDGDLVYTVSSEGHIFCLNASSGAVIWSKHLVRDFGARSPTWTFAGSVVIEGNMALINANKSGIALNKTNGALIWSSAKGKGGYSTPVLFSIGNMRTMALFGETALYGVEVATGRVLWEYGWVTSYAVNAADPLVIGNTVFVTSGYNTGSALLQFSASSITKKWDSPLMASHFTSPVLYNGAIIGIDGNMGSSAAFQILDTAVGSSKLRQSMRTGNFILVGDKAVIISERGELSINTITTGSFTQVSQAKLKSGVYWTMPIYSSGRLFIRNAAGDLFCISVR
ncbi:MAG: hypothetical protein EHM28_12185, partial [Spirochaetaceae bacterium]